MGNLILLAICFSAGILLRKTGRFPENAHLTLNTVVIYVALPALILSYLHNFSLTKDTLAAIAMPWVLFLIGAVFFYIAGRSFRLPTESIAALTLVGGLGNTSFIGIPLVEALHGRDGIPLAIIIDQAGTYLVLSTLGILSLAIYTTRKKTAKETLTKILTFPPFLAMLTAIMLMHISYPPSIEVILRRLGDMVAPLAVISVGFQIRMQGVGENLKALQLGLTYKLLICPLIILIAFHILEWEFPRAIFSTHVVLLESSMGPQIGAGIVATQYQQNPQLVTLMIGLGTLLSLVTVPMWSEIFHFVARAG